MGRGAKSQWDFGELFPPEQSRPALTVSELTGRIRRSLEKDFSRVRVSGEITNFKAQASGHLYFSIKDASAQLNCVLFRGEIGIDRSVLQDGRKVTLGGDITVYEPRGVYQLRVTSVELEGVGALQVAFERLKEKLKIQGWFAPERKRPLPEYPERIGLVTSPTGAAIRDVLHVIGRRNPSLEIVLAPCRVQGEGAAAEIAAALAHLNALSASGEPGTRLDLVLVTRGGGSLEDLWAFNEEIVARTIFESALPVVSAVGHEVDFSISDFVADLRAATPSAAAELITEGVFSRCRFLADAQERMAQLVARHCEDKAEQLDQLRLRILRMHPRRRVEDGLQRLDEFSVGMSRCARQGCRRHLVAWRNLADRLARVRPALLLARRGEALAMLTGRLRDRAEDRLELWKNRLGTAGSRLRLLGPEQVLARGYSITMDAGTGRVLRDPAEVSAGQRLTSRLEKGSIDSLAAPPGS